MLVKRENLGIEIYPIIEQFNKQGAVRYDIANYTMYSDVKTDGEDIALIKLNASLDFEQANVNSICLPVRHAYNEHDEYALIAGYGFMDSEQKTKPGTHQGDSGGPLIQFVDGRAVLIGAIRKSNNKLVNKKAMNSLKLTASLRHIYRPNNGHNVNTIKAFIRYVLMTSLSPGRQPLPLPLAPTPPASMTSRMFVTLMSEGWPTLNRTAIESYLSLSVC
ncbi:unnamed protein product [Oppiella nova]|uniref:Peptidase S1 domain-containing protein n=1 Tax=Oppiella nova TaxID=334625 RepID=A0A7R9LVY9_9ACAR|nr:unnamed protein product [Oppiella nova]CAG2167482.1 unnamed protein product [Oppiella nova]